MASTKQIPATLKSLAPILQRADELEAREPLIAYYCRTYAAQLGIAIMQKSKDDETKRFLFTLLDSLEQNKQDLSPDAEQGKLLVEVYALRLFKRADDAERTRKCDSVVAKLFYVASILLEVTKQFGELSEDMQEKQRYSRWRAAEITKAVKSGTLPTTGPWAEQQEEETHDNEHNPTSPDQSHAYVANNNPPSITTSASGSQSQFTTSPPSNNTENSFYQPPQNQFAPSAQFSPTSPQNDTSPKFNYSDANTNNNKSVTANNQSQSSNNNNSLADDYNKFISQHTAKPKQEEHKTVYNHSDIESQEVTLEAIVEAQKFAKYAVSALQFRDVKTAIKNLHDALTKLKAI